MVIKDYKKVIEKLAGGFKLGADLTPEKLNKTYDQQYDKSYLDTYAIILSTMSNLQFTQSDSKKKTTSLRRGLS